MIPCLSIGTHHCHCLFLVLCVTPILQYSVTSSLPYSFPYLWLLLSSLFPSSSWVSSCPQTTCLCLLASHLLAVSCHSPGLLLAPSQPTSTNSDPQAEFLSLGFSRLSAKSGFSYCCISLVGTVELYITASWKVETKIECLPNHSLADTQIYIHIVGLLP